MQYNFKDRKRTTYFKYVKYVTLWRYDPSFVRPCISLLRLNIKIFVVLNVATLVIFKLFAKCEFEGQTVDE